MASGRTGADAFRHHQRVQQLYMSAHDIVSFVAVPYDRQERWLVRWCKEAHLRFTRQPRAGPRIFVGATMLGLSPAGVG